MEKAEISTHIIPYKGFPKGWNVILYDDLHHTCEEVFEILEKITDQHTAIEIIHIVGDNGYAIIHTSDEKTFAEHLIRHLQTYNFQVELFFQE